MVKKTIFLIFLMSLMLVLGVNASNCAFVTPVSGGYLTTGSLINMTYADFNISIGEIVIHINASSISTANSSSYEITLCSNETNADNMPSGYINWSFNDTTNLILEPANDYTFVGWIENVTPGAYVGSVVCNATVTNIKIDRGDKPSTPTTTTTAGTLSFGSTLTYTVNDANTTECRIAFMPHKQTASYTGSNTKAMTYSGTSCTYTIGYEIADGLYDMYGWASDGMNHTESAKLAMTIDVRVDDTVDGYEDMIVPVAKKITEERFKNIAVILLVIMAAYFGFKALDKK